MTIAQEKRTCFSHAEEQELLRHAAEGDKQAMEELCRQYRPLVLHAAHQPHLATVREDAESEAMLSLIEAIHAYDPTVGAPFAAYAKRKVFGDIRTYFRRERAKWQSEFVPSETEDGGSVWEEFADTSRDMEEAEMGDIIRHALSQLSPKERDTIECLLTERMTQVELAQKHGVAFQTITKWKQKAAKKLSWLRETLRS